MPGSQGLSSVSSSPSGVAPAVTTATRRPRTSAPSRTGSSRSRQLGVLESHRPRPSPPLRAHSHHADQDADHAATTSTKCPVPPTATNICKQPTNIWHGYKPGKPVGGIELPMVTCNDLKDDWHAGRPWKMYTDADSRKCMSYPHLAVPNACRDACKEQYDDCKETYAEGCRQQSENPGFGLGLSWPFKRSLAGRTWGWIDTWKSAMDKCHAQYSDCLIVNKNAAAKGKCHAWGSGW
ncbi:hypothetical protein MCOR02_001715 [Pyricularia oryzae]|nr:hypothetical protein MCOR02_001715 [Pyricularia oryzae]